MAVLGGPKDVDLETKQVRVDFGAHFLLLGLGLVIVMPFPTSYILEKQQQWQNLDLI